MNISKPHVALYVRIPAELRARIEAKRLADAGDQPWSAQNVQQLVISALDAWCGQPLIAEPPTNGKHGKRARK
jgi:hypothetical protein